MERRDCMLQMDELYFSSFDFEQSREDSNTEYDVSFHIEYAKNKKDSAKFRVMIRTAVENKTGSVRIRLDTVGIFTIENFELDRDLNERILKANTVAIMFPYIRSQISLLTTQPGLHPVMLPPMNINALLDSTEEAYTQQKSRTRGLLAQRALLAFPEYNGKKQPRSARAGLRFYSLTTALYSEKLSLPFLSAA